MRYWLTEPERHYQEGYINVGEIPFPDLKTLMPAERKALRKVLERHPEYLHEIACLDNKWPN